MSTFLRRLDVSFDIAELPDRQPAHVLVAHSKFCIRGHDCRLVALAPLLGAAVGPFVDRTSPCLGDSEGLVRPVLFGPLSFVLPVKSTASRCGSGPALWVSRLAAVPRRVPVEREDIGVLEAKAFVVGLL